MLIYAKQPVMSVIEADGETIITKELHCRRNKMLLAICLAIYTSTRHRACPSARSAVGVCSTGQSQGSQAISVQLHPMALLC